MQMLINVSYDDEQIDEAVEKAIYIAALLDRGVSIVDNDTAFYVSKNSIPSQVKSNIYDNRFEQAVL